MRTVVRAGSLARAGVGAAPEARWLAVDSRGEVQPPAPSLVPAARGALRRVAGAAGEHGREKPPQTRPGRNCGWRGAVVAAVRGAAATLTSAIWSDRERDARYCQGVARPVAISPSIVRFDLPVLADVAATKVGAGDRSADLADLFFGLLRPDPAATGYCSWHRPLGSPSRSFASLKSYVALSLRPGPS